MDWDYNIVSKFSDIKTQELKGQKVSVVFRPSGVLHIGNLLAISYAAVIANRLDLDLDLMCCDTDWSAHIHEYHLPDNNKVMKLFFQRNSECQCHKNIAEHRMDELKPFLTNLQNILGINIERNYLTDINTEKDYQNALENILENMNKFDNIFDGGFRRRYTSPIVNTCSNCGFSYSKGSVYSFATGELVSECRNPECEKVFARGTLDDEIGVYYLVDPVRDISRNVAVHVFGGDYRTAEKEQATPKIQKVAEITDLAAGETPAYFLSPLISDEKGIPLSKSKNPGKAISDIEDLGNYTRILVSKIENWIEKDKRYIPQSKL